MRTPRPVNDLARAGGAILSAVTSLVDTVRGAEKPLHPRGTVWESVLERTGHAGPPSGVAWIDEPGTDQGLTRVSTAVGLPPGWPDFQGLALRVTGADGFVDVLLASTGTGRVTRFVLRPARSPQAPAYTTVLPYRGPRGPVLLAARAAGEQAYTLSWATAQGPWHSFARLRLARPVDQRISFDPLRFPPPGLEAYGWSLRLRAPAYRTAQRGRRAGSHDE